MTKPNDPERSARPGSDRTAVAPGHEITIDARRGHLHIAAYGFWDAGHLAAANGEIGRAIAELVRNGTPYGEIRTLIDLRATSILAQGLTGMSQEIGVAHAPASSKVAIVCGTALQQLQQKRLSTSANISFFQDAEEARRWLFSD